MADAPVMATATIPATARATSTSRWNCPFCANSSPSMPMPTPTTTQAPSTHHVGRSGTPVSISRVYPSSAHGSSRRSSQFHRPAADFGGNHFFINNQYLDGNTNKGFLLGNAIGRDARAIEGRTGYWFSARTRVEAGYRQNKGGTLFLPGGGTITDGFVNGSFAINPHWTAQVFTQYERFLIPSYMPGSQHNTSGWLQLTWEPNLHLFR